MHTYTYPKPKEESTDPLMSSPDQWERRISLPVNQEIMDALAVDDEVTLMLEAKVTEMSSHDGENGADRTITFVVSRVEVEGEEEMAQAEFATGFARGPKRY